MAWKKFYKIVVSKRNHILLQQVPEYLCDNFKSSCCTSVFFFKKMIKYLSHTQEAHILAGKKKTKNAWLEGTNSSTRVEKLIWGTVLTLCITLSPCWKAS